ncbi:hypothetical protein A3C98_03595 [Candidatus Roizmanbacteria bacterium RIFCSPHIGHO2_02_FULL_37_15]|uniref:O-antigen ligase-related domain-containing protein n=1 Tax=Candidatus Roizmanbacteria bacterium RIFCSPLOWO2_01_FULL_37_16 TaxID=1802058 RepID=A0A1F7IIZ0_9BACT|nr:MAG: hypothetical protein A3C98_03595 [Candidatus Roizmanbacteria bacterium RIFCSPHIGHO2_02_FULL_37_15]OGK43307.1 MAG: hypothetical protein A3B40_02335 [Candidatus Roizmanbacteria bacterium RIFCSPLOWO2_01_FULL_37_16]
MKFLFYLSFSLLSLGQLTRISFFGQQINIYLYEILAIFILLNFLIKYGLGPLSEYFKKFKFVYFLFLYLPFSFLLLFGDFKALENFISLLYYLRLVLYFLYFFYLTYHLKKQLDFKNVLLRSLNIFIFLTIISSLAQYFWYPELRNLLYAGWDPHLYRLFGTFLDTSVAGAVYGIILLTLFLKGSEFIKTKWLFIGLLVIYFLFTVFTYSRSLYLTLFLLGLLYAATKKRLREFIIFAVIFLILLIVAPKPFGEGVNLMRTFSIESRLDDYKTAINIWQKRPFFGYGYNRIRYVKRQMNISDEVGSDITHSGASFHSSFLVILVSGGIIGLILFIGVLYQLYNLSEMSKYLLLFLGLLSLTDNIFLHPFILFLFLNSVTLAKLTPSRK